jgi:hypothetical protein
LRRTNVVELVVNREWEAEGNRHNHSEMLERSELAEDAQLHR